MAVHRKTQETNAMQNAQTISLVMFQYSIDHDGHYPDGKSSTEVFQKLLDGRYVAEPSLFYVPMPGKVAPESGKPLKAENVSWDVTCCLNSSEGGALPLVFLTGYRIDYTPGGSAHLIHPEKRSWFEFWDFYPPLTPGSGIVVAYRLGGSNGERYRPASRPEEGFIPHLISRTADFHGKIYHQLTPDGSVP